MNLDESNAQELAQKATDAALEARAIANVIEVAIYNGTVDDDDVRFAMKAIARICDEIGQMTGTCVERLRKKDARPAPTVAHRTVRRRKR